MNVQEYNSTAWDKEVERGIEWSIPVSSEIIENARKGIWEIVLTPLKSVPREWFGDLKGKDVLCLASGGGQQAPVLAATGAKVTSFDNSAKQLELDKQVAARDNLEIRFEKGDATDLSRFSDESFDLIFHPVSNVFFPNIQPVWQECFRVLRRGGILLAGFHNSFFFIFNREADEDKGILEVKYPLPYSDLESLSEEELRKYIDKEEPLAFGHTLEQQIGGQIVAGFWITGFYEDYWSDTATTLNKFAPTFIATKAMKP